ncbi:hypothetical protein MAR_014624 [Mya arenaria]|uniref:Asl1-like glycosyl hydrolase catalytic domain-containing protein n=1 Tax=Mya arenaria TaxID=6604 RepID=A0ABY7G429_MYAAR|nr:hypothetical protein MAR_014624 [Mya arenaria]
MAPMHVPMIKKMWKNGTHPTLTPGARYVLGYNEPNKADQADMTPKQAADFWPEVERLAAGLPLISPVTAGQNFPWLDEFFRLCHNCRVQRGRDNDVRSEAAPALPQEGVAHGVCMSPHRGRERSASPYADIVAKTRGCKLHIQVLVIYAPNLEVYIKFHIRMRYTPVRLVLGSTSWDRDGQNLGKPARQKLLNLDKNRALLQ